MTIALSALEVRHERRIRLTFTNNVASGAFGFPAPAFYTVTCTDGRGTSPSVSAALLVSGATTTVELALGASLVKGAAYTVSAVGVPATDASTTGVDSVLGLRWGLQELARDVEPTVRDRQRSLYGVDLLWTGADFQETASGDLERVAGTANVTKALNKRVQTNPGDVHWDTTYGAGVRNFVDSPSEAAGTLRGAVSSQILRDPRVKSLKMSHEIDAEKTYLYADPVLVSGEAVERVSIEVPNE